MSLDKKVKVTTDLVLEKLWNKISYIEIDEEYFVELLKHSLSLDIENKNKVVESFFRLSQAQFDALFETFENERKQFREVAEKYPAKIVELVEKRKLEWIELWELIKNKELEQEQKSKEEDKINDIKSNLGL